MPKDTTIKQFRTSTAEAVPDANALAAGELAINLTDKKLFCGDTAGTSYIELTRRAASAAVEAGTATLRPLQYTDDNGYLTGNTSAAYYLGPGDGEYNDQHKFVFGNRLGLISNYTDISATHVMGVVDGNPAQQLNIVAPSEINIGDNSLQVSNGIGINVSQQNLNITMYGDVQISMDPIQNTNGTLTVDGDFTCFGSFNAQSAVGVNGGSVFLYGNQNLFDSISITNLPDDTTVVELYEDRLYATNKNNRRSLIPTENFARVLTTRSINNNTTAQNVFASANDTIKLAADTTYIFEGVYRIGSGTTSHTTEVKFDESVALGDGGTTWTWFVFSIGGAANSATRTQDCSHFVTAAGGAANTASTNAITIIWLRGMVTTPTTYTDSTITPQIKFGTAPGATTEILAGTFLRFTPIGDSTVESVGFWA